jgi:hypothetical protein
VNLLVFRGRIPDRTVYSRIKNPMPIEETIQAALHNQFGASLAMMENAIQLCPDELWDTPIRFWYHAYHGLYWTDYYLTAEPDEFQPMEPFDFSEFETTETLLPRTYSKLELLDYAGYCRAKGYAFIGSLNAETINNRWINAYKNYSYLEIVVYKIRHLQHHVAQLNLLLRQEIHQAPDWVSQAEE